VDTADGKILSKHNGIGKAAVKNEEMDMEWCSTFPLTTEGTESVVGLAVRRPKTGADVLDHPSLEIMIGDGAEVVNGTAGDSYHVICLYASKQ
jgi:hypothetical protein